MVWCASKTKVIKIDEIQQVIVETDHSVSHRVNRVHYDSFKVLFKLIGNRTVVGCSGVINRYGESTKALRIIRQGLPPNIQFCGNLVY